MREGDIGFHQLTDCEPRIEFLHFLAKLIRVSYNPAQKTLNKARTGLNRL